MPIKSIMKKPVRTISGVTPLTVVLPPRKCNHGTCIYCPGGEFVPQSYTDKSPAIMRALALKFDPYKQVKSRLNSFEKMGHPTDKIELIIIGGTFLQYDLNYQRNFIKHCFDALNGKTSKSLEQAKKLNERLKHRCVAMCIETRPDNCSDEEIKTMLDFGTTRVEIGVQILDDQIYKKINRGHTIKEVVDATRRLKNAGFKIGYHIMPGLPSSNLKKDIDKFKMVFADQRFKPDQIKIYPCQVVDNSPLAKIHKKINYEPYNSEQMSKLLAKMFLVIPRYCRVMRIMREIPKEKMLSEVIKLELRKDVEKKLRADGFKIKEIRMREIGFNQKNLNLDLKLKVTKYKASDGDEYFLEIVNKEDILFGLLRLRVFASPPTRPTTENVINFSASRIGLDKNYVNVDKNFRGGLNNKFVNNNNLNNVSLMNKGGVKFITNNFKSARNLSESKISSKQNQAEREKIAIIRELHVYGQAINLGEKWGSFSKRTYNGRKLENETAIQHQGLGKWLLAEAEKIVHKNKIKKLKIISGVGVREYYRKLGYELDKDEVYMEKSVIP